MRRIPISFLIALAFCLTTLVGCTGAKKSPPKQIITLSVYTANEGDTIQATLTPPIAGYVRVGFRDSLYNGIAMVGGTYDGTTPLLLDIPLANPMLASDYKPTILICTTQTCDDMTDLYTWFDYSDSTFCHFSMAANSPQSCKTDSPIPVLHVGTATYTAIAAESDVAGLAQLTALPTLGSPTAQGGDTATLTVRSDADTTIIWVMLENYDHGFGSKGMEGSPPYTNTPVPVVINPYTTVSATAYPRILLGDASQNNQDYNPLFWSRSGTYLYTTSSNPHGVNIPITGLPAPALAISPSTPAPVLPDLRITGLPQIAVDGTTITGSTVTVDSAAFPTSFVVTVPITTAVERVSLGIQSQVPGMPAGYTHTLFTHSGVTSGSTTYSAEIINDINLLQPGTYQLEFTAEDLNSWIYYRMYINGSTYFKLVTTTETTYFMGSGTDTGLPVYTLIVQKQ